MELPQGSTAKQKEQGGENYLGEGSTPSEPPSPRKEGRMEDKNKGVKVQRRPKWKRLCAAGGRLEDHEEGCVAF
jgi:hypothetical protein